MEVPAAFLIGRFGFGRWAAVTTVGVGAFAIGLPAALSYGVLSEFTILGKPVLDAMDGLASNWLLPLGGIAIALFAGWRWGAHRAIAASDLGDGALGHAWVWLLRLVVPAVILVVLLRSAGGH